MDPYLRIIIRRIIDRKSCTVTKLLQDHPKFPIDHYKLLLNSQEQILLIKFLKGFPRTQWDHHQLRYVKEKELTMKPGEEFWLAKIFVNIHHQTHLRWQQRNSKIHGEDNEYTQNNLLLRIQSFYALINDLSTQDQQPFCIPIKEWPNKTSQEMTKWLNVHSEHIKVCLKHEK